MKYKDFDYRDPDKPLKVEQTAPKNTDLEIYDYNVERYRDDGRGRDLAKVLVDAEAARRKTLGGLGNLAVGARGVRHDALQGLPVRPQRGLAGGQVDHSASQEADTGVQYCVSLYAIPADMRSPHRADAFPSRSLNPQTATVVGPSGEQDLHGRPRARQGAVPLGPRRPEGREQLVLDPRRPALRRHRRDTQKKHGFQWHPLIGDEVVVDFLEGDPDNPLIVGSVYNDVNMRPIKPDGARPQPHPDPLPAPAPAGRQGHRHHPQHRRRRAHLPGGRGRDPAATTATTSSTRRRTGTSSTWPRGQGARGIRLESAAGHQVVLDDKEERIRARSKDGHLLELDDANKRILIKSSGGHMIQIDDNANTITVRDSSSSHSLTIDAAGSSISVQTAGSLSMTVGTNMTLTVGGSLSVSVGGDTSLTFGANLNETVGGSETHMTGVNLITLIGDPRCTPWAAHRRRRSAASGRPRCRAPTRPRLGLTVPSRWAARTPSSRGAPTRSRRPRWTSRPGR